MDLAIERRELEPERMLTTELTTTPERFDADLSAAYGRLSEVLSEAGAVYAGAGICAHPMGKANPGEIVAVAGIPFNGPVEPGADMKIEESPGGPALVGLLHGSYEQLPEAWVEMNESLGEDERPRPKTAPFDRFLRSMVNVVSPDELITELVLPLA